MKTAYIFLCLALTVYGSIQNQKDEPRRKLMRARSTDIVRNYNLERRDIHTKKWEKIGSKDACNGDATNMRFFAVPNNRTQGQCDCDYYECSRPLLYSPLTKQCHWAWSQGPCQKKEWYTFDKYLKPVCEENPCPTSPANGTMTFYFKRPEDGKCYQATTKGYCQKKNEVLMISPLEPIPTCRSSTKCFPLSRPQSQECIQGNKYTFDGFCEDDD